MEKTFKFAGVARHIDIKNNALTVRYANDQYRIKMMSKWGFKDVDLLELKHPMTKQEAIQFLLDINFAGQDAETQECLLNALSKNPRAKVPSTSKKEEVFADVDRAIEEKKQEDAKAKLQAIFDRANKKAPRTTLTKAEVQKQLDDLENTPF